MLRIFQIAIALAVVSYVYPMFMNFLDTMHHVAAVLN